MVSKTVSIQDEKGDFSKLKYAYGKETLLKKLTCVTWKELQDVEKLVRFTHRHSPHSGRACSCGSMPEREDCLL